MSRDSSSVIAILPLDLPNGTEIRVFTAGVVLIHSWRNNHGLHIVRCAISREWCQEPLFAKKLENTLTDFWLAVGLEMMSAQALDEDL